MDSLYRSKRFFMYLHLSAVISSSLSGKFCDVTNENLGYVKSSCFFFANLLYSAHAIGSHEELKIETVLLIGVFFYQKSRYIPKVYEFH